MSRPPMCQTPGCNEVAEMFEDYEGGWYDTRCPYCNDKLIERANKRREWDYYHPGEPCPESELSHARKGEGDD